jgi:tetratricopeptide (TPR) repeat protein
MKASFLKTLMIGTALMLSPSAWAEAPSQRLMIGAGHFTAAAEQADTLQTSDAYALASEALLSEIMLGQAQKNKKQAKRARKLAEAALAIDPAHQNARLQYAIADGFVTRETGDVSAWMKKLPQKTHAVVQAYRTDFPDDPRGDALLGAGHLAIARKAGDGNAKKWFDASVAEGIALYEAALVRSPNDPVISVNYAFALIALEAEDRPDPMLAKARLEQVATLEPNDVLNATMVNYARTALAQIDDVKAVSEYAGTFLDGKRPS